MTHKEKKRYNYTEKELSIINNFISDIWELGYLRRRDVAAVDSLLYYIEGDTGSLAENIEVSEKDVARMNEEQVLEKIYKKYIEGN